MDGSFVEPLSVPELESFKWPFDFALFRHTEYKYNVSMSNLIENSKENLFSTRLSGGKTANQWNEIFSNEFNCPEDLYQNIAESANAKLISFRWNQQSFYSSNWLSRSQNHYWLSIIRNPYDRIYSNMKTHGWDFTRALKVTSTFNDNVLYNLDKFSNFILVYYEELILDPEKVTRSICNKLGIKFLTSEPNKLLGANYHLYRTQGYKTKNPIRTYGDRCSSYYKSSIGTGQSNLSSYQTETIKSFIKNLELFKKYNNK